ncbi:hypothetical protein ACA910_012295 [Epithemia clementina (nom. ined.)]
MKSSSPLTVTTTTTAPIPLPTPSPLPPPSPWIETLQNLRLLPPPCNDLVPLLTTIVAFSVALLCNLPPVSWMTAFQQHFDDDGDKGDKGVAWWSSCILFGVYMAVYWGYSLVMHVAEQHNGCVSTLVHFKIQPKAPLTTWQDLQTMIPVVLFNQLVLGFPLIRYAFVPIILFHHRWKHSADPQNDNDNNNDFLGSVPNIPTFVATLLIHVLCSEVWFYLAHRLLHTVPFLYQHVHYLHHAYKAPSCIESVYVHPLEYVANSFAVLWIGPMVTAPSLLVVAWWIALCTFLQVHDHCGYWLPFLPKVLMHEYHHMHISCCYGILGLLDHLCQTEFNFQTFVQEKENSNPCFQTNKDTNSIRNKKEVQSTTHNNNKEGNVDKKTT